MGKHHHSESLLHSNTTEPLLLEKNCREELPIGLCIFGNTCGLISTGIWFIVLFPQILKNYRRKSVAGLSFLWALANFTASLVNIFFVFFYAKLPVYVKIEAVYMPTLEFAILCQFFFYDDAKQSFKYICAAGCGILWTIIIVLEVVFRTQGWYNDMLWVAIALWSVETFPQVILNIKRMSTSGQATLSVIISLVGKTTDFLSGYILILPLQFVIMTYFSSTMAFINGMQVVWYWEKRSRRVEGNNSAQPQISGNLPEPVSNTDSFSYKTLEADTAPSVMVLNPNRNDRRNKVLRYILVCFLGFVILAYSGALVWNTGSSVAILAPLGIGVVLMVTYIYYHGKEGFFRLFNSIGKW